MQFGKYEYIYLLWLVPALAVFFYYAFKRKAAALELFSQRELLKELVADVSVRKQKFKALLLVAAAGFALFALMNPKWGFHWEEVRSKGIDIVILLDTSKSMLAQDVKPDRLQMARREIDDFVNSLHGDRVALVTFAGTSFVQCPLTADYGAFKMFLGDVGVNSIPLGGTDIGDAVETGIKAFADRSTKHKIMILITDGEDHGGRLSAAVAAAKERGVVINAVGIGNPAGAPIPVKDEQGLSSFIKDPSGNVVLSKVDEEELKKIARETGGSYISAQGGRIGLEKLYADKIARLEKQEFGASRKRVYESRFQLPLAIAVILILIETMIGDRRSDRRRREVRA
ncbi:MAG TPA: VWA domain-containing protein [bacterium]|nr:VWA domain-containing protein [bacterium]